MPQYTLKTKSSSNPACKHESEPCTKGPVLIYENRGGFSDFPRFISLRLVTATLATGETHLSYEIGPLASRFPADTIKELRQERLIVWAGPRKKGLRPSQQSEAYHAESSF